MPWKSAFDGISMDPLLLDGSIHDWLTARFHFQWIRLHLPVGGLLVSPLVSSPNSSYREYNHLQSRSEGASTRYSSITYLACVPVRRLTSLSTGPFSTLLLEEGQIWNLCAFLD